MLARTQRSTIVTPSEGTRAWRVLAAAFVVPMLLAPAGTRAAPPSYKLVPLGFVDATDINRRGWITGNVSSSQAFLKTSNETVIFSVFGVNEIDAYGVSDSGHVVGIARQSPGGEHRAFRRHPSGTVDELMPFEPTANAEALRVNSDGTAVGWTDEVKSGNQYAARWTETVPHTWFELNSIALDVNNAGQVVGRAQGACFFEDGPVYLTGSPIGGSTARAISHGGHVAGDTRLPGFPRMYEGWILDSDTGSLDVFVTSASLITVTDINIREQVVGWIEGDGAFLVDQGTLYDLEALLADTSAVLQTANAINDCGMIVGRTEDGQAYLLIPRDSTDTDGDGLFDRWELCGLDLDEDGVFEFELPDADWLHKDLYVEADAMTGAGPPQAALDSVVAAFARAPVTNPDLTEGIRLHIPGADCDPCVDESTLPSATWTSPPWADFHALKMDWFGTAADLPWAPGEREAKLLTHRYCIFATEYFTSTGRRSSGRANDIPSRDFFVALGAWSSITAAEYASTFMHEFGHTLGLRHGGSDHIRYKPNYYSVMNYTWQMPGRKKLTGLADSALALWRASWRLDYSRVPLNSLDESSLDESSGIGGDPLKWVPAGPEANAFLDWTRLVPMGGPVDWSQDLDFTDSGVEADVNRLPPIVNPSPGERLESSADWPNLDYLPITHPNWSSARPPHRHRRHTAEDDSLEEITFEEYDQLNQLRFDCNGNNVPDDEEIEAGKLADRNHNGVPDVCEPAIVNVLASVGLPTLTLQVRSNPAAWEAAQVLTFVLPQFGHASVGIYDVTGAQVATLEDRALEAGVYERTWTGLDSRGRSVSPGVYFVKLQFGQQRSLAKVVRLR